MCFSSGATSMFFWPSLTQCPDDNHPSSLAQASSTLMWGGVGVLSCVQRVRCGVRCGSSSLHRAFANMHIQVSCMDVLRAILVGAAIILRRGAFLVHTEQGISYVALTVNTCLLACKKKRQHVTRLLAGSYEIRHDMSFRAGSGIASNDVAGHGRA